VLQIAVDEAADQQNCDKTDSLQRKALIAEIKHVFQVQVEQLQNKCVEAAACKKKKYLGDAHDFVRCSKLQVGKILRAEYLFSPLDLQRLQFHHYFFLADLELPPTA
jgi:hypothetical protein